MTVEARIKAALDGFGDPVENCVHTGEEDRYYVFSLDRTVVLYADDEPVEEIAKIQLHLFAPLGENLVERIRETQLALLEAGFLWPEVYDATDKDGRHIVFETEG